MASSSSSSTEETIPMLIVVKNNVLPPFLNNYLGTEVVILKNIFIISNNNCNHEENTFLVGRHPDCDIVVTHPSITRFHLQIRSIPSSRVLSLRDLSSVHGTWVNGRKLEAGESVELNQGDTFTLGVSTRVYHLHWVPLTLSQFIMFQQERGQLLKDVSFCTVGNEEIRSMNLIPECNNSLPLDVNLELTLEKEITLPEGMVSFCCDEERKNHLKDETFGVLNGRPLGTVTSYFPANSDIENNLCDCPGRVLAPPYVQSVDEVDCTEKTQACSEVEMPGETNLFCTFGEYLKENICLRVAEAVQGIKMQQSPDTLNTSLAPSKQESSFEENWSSLVTNNDPASFDEKHDTAMPVIPKEFEFEFGCTVTDNDQIEDIFTTGARIFNSENTCLPVGEVIPDSKFHQIKIVEEFSVDSPSGGEKQDKCVEEYKSKWQDLTKSCHVQGQSQEEMAKDIGSQSTCKENMVPASFDEKGLAAVTVVPKESEFGCTIGDKDRIEDILTSGARTSNSENTSLLVMEAIPVTNFQQIKIVEKVGVDSIFYGEKQDTYGEKFESKLQAQLTDKYCEDTGNKCSGSICPISLRVESLNSLGPLEAVLEVTDEKENQTLQSLIAVTGCSEMEILESYVETKESDKYCHEQGLKVLETVEDIGNNCVGNISSISVLVESVNSPMPQEADLKTTNQKENQTPQSLIAMAGCSEMKTLENLVEATESAKYFHEQGHSLDERVEDSGHNCTGSISLIPVQVESVNSMVPQEAEDIGNICTGSISPMSVLIESVNSLVPQEAEDIGNNCTGSISPISVMVESVNSPVPQEAEDIGNNSTGSISPISVMVESVNSPVPHEADLKMTNKKENQTPKSLIAMAGCSEMEVLESRVEATDKSSTFGNVWSRRGMAASAPQVRTRKSRFMCTSNVDNEVEIGNEKKDIIKKSMPKDLFSVLDGEEEIFTPNKENFSPNTLLLKFMRKQGKLEEIKHSKSQRSQNSMANFNFSPSIYSDERITAISNKGNQTVKVAQEQKSQRKPLQCHMSLAQEQAIVDMKKKRVERITFQSLMNSGGKHKPGTAGPVSAEKIIDASNWEQISDKHTNPFHIGGGQKRSWVMVVDTASLLNKESRKALRLLQGLKGIRLIIPSLVIRELDNMKRQQFSIFRRSSQASLALEWVEECMENTKWWIHIQSSMEEHMLIASTPPASPQTQLVEESGDFPGSKSSKEIASPTVEDHIIDFALLYRRKENGGQLVLLSDDITLKIKSMAEGLLCETVQEFRQGLVNPFSERFMWANSSPRGLTWSCKDDVVLREKYCALSSKAGLKLITQQFLHFQI